MKTFLISNSQKVAQWSNSAGVTWVMVDIETHGKQERQSGTRSWISDHALQDCWRLRPLLTSTKLAIRINPIHESSDVEVEQAIDAGVDLIMLPMAKTLREVDRFSDLVDNRVKKSLLVETPELLGRLPWILENHQFETIHMGLNDLSLTLGLQHMLQTLLTGYVEMFADCATRYSVDFGFGGIGRLDVDLPINAYDILIAHAVLGSDQVILSRSFMHDLSDEGSFAVAVSALRKAYSELVHLGPDGLLPLKKDAWEKLSRLGSPDRSLIS